MCRDIKILRAPYANGVTDEDVQAAALQYVRTVSGFRRSYPSDVEAFDMAVIRVAAVTQDLLDELAVPPALPESPWA
jgi:hypothetical protein